MLIWYRAKGQQKILVRIVKQGKAYHMTRMLKSDNNQTIFRRKSKIKYLAQLQLWGRRAESNSIRQQKMKKQINSICLQMREMNAVLMIQVIRDGIK